jgi:hypothetical protein
MRLVADKVSMEIYSLTLPQLRLPMPMLRYLGSSSKRGGWKIALVIPNRLREQHVSPV